MYGKLLAKSKRGKKGAGTVAASAAKAPPGYSLAPGSKKGRYRKKVAGRWQYYDPNKTSTKTHAAKVAALAESLKGAPASLTDVIHAAALGDFARASKLGMAYKANHHKIDELIELLHVAEVAAHQPIHIAAHAVGSAAHAVASAVGGAGHLLQQAMGAFAMGGTDWLAKGGEDDEDDEDKEEEARDKKIAQENGEDDDEGDGDDDEDAAEDRKEQARDSFNASMSFGALIRKSVAHKYVSRSPDGSGGWRYRYATDVRNNMGSVAAAQDARAELEANAGHHGRALLAARAKSGKTPFLDKLVGRSKTHEMETHEAGYRESLEDAKMLKEADKFHTSGAEYDDVPSLGDKMLAAFVGR